MSSGNKVGKSIRPIREYAESLYCNPSFNSHHPPCATKRIGKRDELAILWTLVTQLTSVIYECIYGSRLAVEWRSRLFANADDGYPEIPNT